MSKTNRRTFSFPLRNKKILLILDLLYKYGAIAGYELPKKFYYNKSGAVMFSKKKGNYYTPVRIILRSGPKPLIKTIGSPGKRVTYSWKKLNRVRNRFAHSAIFIVSSSRLKKICNAHELRDFREGCTPLFIVTFDGYINI